MLREETLYGVVDKVEEAIQVLKECEPPEGYYLAFSGGKDSITILKKIPTRPSCLNRRISESYT